MEKEKKDMDATYASMLSPAVDILQETVKELSRVNFYLWLYIAQEADYDDAVEYVNCRRNEPTPFEAFLRTGTCNLLNKQFVPQEDDFF